MKKVLIFYASYGGGHLSAAKSIKQHIEENYKDFEVEMTDCMKIINKTIDKLTTGAYREMAKKRQNYGVSFILALKKVYFLKLVKIVTS